MTAVLAGLVAAIPLGALWGGGSLLLARRADRRLARYDAEVIEKAGRP